MNEVNVLLEPVRAFLAEVGVFLPRLALAVVVLAAGWVLAKLGRFTVIKACKLFSRSACLNLAPPPETSVS